MRVIISLFILATLTLMAGAAAPSFYHETPSNIILGETAHLELSVNDFSAAGSDVQDVRVFYRTLGSEQFESAIMKSEGYSYFAELNTSKWKVNQIEYYFAYRNKLGTVKTIPADNPDMNPYILNITPAQVPEQTAAFEIVVLSPELNEAIPRDEIIIAASVLGGEADIDFDQSQLLIDGVNVSKMADFSNGVITFSPEGFRIGRHNIELQLVDNEGQLIASKEWAFRAIESEEVTTPK